MSLRDCLDAVKAASGGVLGDEDALELLDRLEARARRRIAAGGDPAAERAKAAEELAAEVRGRARQLRRTALLTARRKTQILDDLERMRASGLSYADGLLALMGGVASRAPGTRRSAWALQRAYLSRYWGHIMGTIARERPHLERMIARGHRWLRPDPEFLAFDRRVLQEMERIGREAEIPPTGDDDAAWLARLLHDTAERARQDLEALGASIGRLEGWTPHVHDPWRVARVSEDDWIDFVLPLLDLERTFPEIADDPDAVRAALREIYRNIVTGRDLVPRGEVRHRGPARILRGFEHHRVLHFKPGAWATYSERFGVSGSVIASVFQHLQRVSQRAGLAEAFGPNPDWMLDAIVDTLTLRVRLRDPAAEAAREISRLRRAREWPTWRGLTGEVHLPGNETLARAGAAVRALEVMSKLTAALLSALPTDPFIAAANMRFMGKPFLRAHWDTLREMLKGRGRDADRSVAFYLGEGFDGLVDHVVVPWVALEEAPGVMTRLANIAMRISGLTGWTDLMRAAAARMTTAWLGRHAHLAWAELPERLKHVLRLHGLDDPAWWEAARKLTVEVDGTPHLAPWRAAELRPVELLPLVRDRLDALDASLFQRLRARAERRAKEAAALEKRRRELAAWVRREREKWRDRRGRLDEAWRTRMERLDARLAELLARLDHVEAWFTEKEWDIRLERPRARIADIRGARARGRREQHLLERLDDLRREAERLEQDLADRLADLDAATKGRIRDRLARLKRWEEDLRRRWAESEERDVRDLERHARAVHMLVEEARRELEIRLRAMLADEITTAVLEPDVRAVAVSTAGLRAGTLPGELVRAMMQFKSFAIAFTQRVIARRVYADVSTGAGVAGLAELIALTTLGGLFAMWAKDISKGRTPKELFDEEGNPRPQTLLAAALQGGGLGIYGDFLFGSYNRFGRGAFETLSGPAIGDLAELMGLYEELRSGEPRASRFVAWTLGLTPFINLWYTRAALDLLVLNALRESVSPGWLARQRRRMLEEYGQDWLVRPVLLETRP